MKIMKKSIATISAITMLTMGALTFTGCSDEDEKKVMNVALNPSVEFVLNGDNEVVSVNALNEEGNLVVSSEAFANIIGKDADVAVKTFVQVTEDMGFLVETNTVVGADNLSVSISGDTKDANKLYADVKATVSGYVTEANIAVTIEQAAPITEEDLKKLVAECAPYMEPSDIDKLEYMELVETVYESRKETVDFYSQELKAAYYEAKANVMENAEIDVLKAQLNVVSQGLVTTLQELYNGAVDLLENARMTHLVSEDSLYQKALQAVRAKKVEYLNYRAEIAAMEASEVNEEKLARLTSLEQALNDAEAALLRAGEAATETLNGFKASLTEAHEKVIAKIQELDVKISAHLTEISAKQQEAKAQFFTDFETNYAAAITAAETNWKDMKADLEAKTNANAGENNDAQA